MMCCPDRADCITRWIDNLGKEKSCATCVHYRQHYIRSSSPYADHGYIPAVNGICNYPRSKPRRIYDTCDKFERR